MAYPDTLKEFSDHSSQRYMAIHAVIVLTLCRCEGLEATRPVKIADVNLGRLEVSSAEGRFSKIDLIASFLIISH